MDVIVPSQHSEVDLDKVAVKSVRASMCRCGSIWSWNGSRLSIRPCCWRPDLPAVGQRYKVTMSAHGHKSVPVLICPWMLLGCHTQTNKQTNKQYACPMSSTSSLHQDSRWVGGWITTDRGLRLVPQPPLGVVGGWSWLGWLVGNNTIGPVCAECV